MGDMADYYDEREDPLDGMAMTSIGFVPITARRGGIQYPQKNTPRPRRSNGWGQRTKERTTMANTPKKLTPKQKVRKLEAELDGNLSLQQVLKAEEERLRADIRRHDVPPPPPASAGDMFRVIVRFAQNGQGYTYLLARSGDRWFTTGTKEEHKVFADWEALCTWLGTTFWHSHVERLQVTGKTSWPTQFEMPF